VETTINIRKLIIVDVVIAVVVVEIVKIVVEVVEVLVITKIAVKSDDYWFL